MRTTVKCFLAVLAFAGCSSGTRTVYIVRERPAPPTTTVTVIERPAPPPAPVAPAPLEIALGRPSAGKLLVQTNRPAYVAIFEIIPREGVALVHPSTPRQSRMVLSGLTWVPVWWEPEQPARRVGNGGGTPRPTRYIYALASDRPLNLPERAFDPAYLRQVLGPSAFNAATPQPAMRALSRHFAPAVASGRWAEDVYAVAPSGSPTPSRVARIYCAGGTIYEVPEEIVGRAWCPVPAGTVPQTTTGPVAADQAASGPSPAAPDSVVDQSGRRLGGRAAGALGRAVGLRDSTPGNGAAPAKPANAATPDHPGRPTNVGTPGRPERAEPDSSARGRAERERVERERVERERVERERVEKERVEKENADRARADDAARAKAQNDKVEKEKAEKDRADKERAERDKAEKDKAEKDKAEKDKAEKDKADRENAERQRAEKERPGNANPPANPGRGVALDPARADRPVSENAGNNAANPNAARAANAETPANGGKAGKEGKAEQADSMPPQAAASKSDANPAAAAQKPAAASAGGRGNAKAGGKPATADSTVKTDSSAASDSTIKANARRKGRGGAR